LAGFDKTFFGDPDHSFARADVHVGSLGAEHDFGAGLSLRHRTMLARYDKFYQNIYPTNLDEATREVQLGAYNSRNDRTNLISQTDLVREGSLLGVDQTLLVGVELGRQWSRNKRLTGTILTGARVPLADPTVDTDTMFAPAGSDADNRTRASIAAAYAQTQLHPARWLELVAGLRLDRFTLKVDDLRHPGTTFSRTDTLVSPRLGTILKPSENLSFYASFARSFLPQSGDQFSGLALNTETLKPERFENLEVGAKWEPVEGLLATAALYQLDRTNTRAVDPVNPALFVLTGAQRTRGLELGLERNITSRWQVSAGYAWQDAKITETTTAAPAGRKVPLVPRHSLSLWSRYDVTRAFGAGLGLIARSKSYASLSNQVTLPGYARVDGALYYKLGGGIEAQLNVENLLGKRYFPTAHNDNNIAPGAPCIARLTLRYGF
jgi:catecholate siderophore receptor